MDLASQRREHLRELRAELDRLVRELVALGAERIVLFGSMVSGQANLLSDIDLIVVMESDLPFVRRVAELYQRLRPCCADILVYTPEEFETMSRTSPLVRHALATGEVLHATSG